MKSPGPRRQNAKRASTTNLGVMLVRYRAMGMISLRDLAKDIGVSAPTVMRMEHGYAPESDTFVKLLNWMMLRAALDREAPR